MGGLNVKCRILLRKSFFIKRRFFHELLNDGAETRRFFWEFLDELRLINFILDNYKNLCYNLDTVKKGENKMKVELEEVFSILRECSYEFDDCDNGEDCIENLIIDILDNIDNER